ncbi:MAG TPA: GNAT family N-acetyltransferase [Actinomycetota bacterium]
MTITAPPMRLHLPTLPAPVRVRPIEPSDGPALQAGLACLSPRSRWLRFHQPLNRFSAAQLRALVEVDHHDREALLAEIEQPDTTWQLIAVARYARVPAPEAEADQVRAELALVVGDPWHRCGVGRMLVDRLAALARERGIAAFEGELLTENRPMLQFLRELGPQIGSSVDFRLFGTTAHAVWHLKET